MCQSYQDILEKDVGLLSKDVIEDIKMRSSRLQKSRSVLEVIDHNIKEK